MIFPVLVVGAIVFGVVMFVRSRQDVAAPSAAQVGSTIRRLFQYALLLGVVALVAAGLSSVLAAALASGELASDRGSLALPLAYLSVGLPAGAVLALWVRREHQANPDEATTLAWGIYLSAMSAIALTVSVVSLIQVAEWLLRAESYSSGALARSLVWTAVWAVHWYLAAAAPQQRRLVWHRLFGSATGLLVGSIGLGNTIAAVLRQIVDSMSDTLAAADYNWTWRNGVAWLLVGGLVWAWYWFAHTLVPDRDTLPFHAYVLVLGVLSGLVTALAGLSGVVLDAFVWWFGDAEPTAREQFSSVPGATAAIATGLWIWWYHRTVLAPERQAGRGEVHRAYDYLVSAIGLVTSASGATILLVALFDTLSSEGSLASDSSGINLVIAALTAFLIGIPVWVTAWLPSQRLAKAEAGEANSRSRRVYLFLLFGIGGTIALISLIVVFFAVFEWLLDESGNVLREIRTPLSLVITIGSLSGYHWSVLRGDRAAFGFEASAIKSIMLIGDRDVGKELARVTGAKVQTIERADESHRLELEEIVEAIDGFVAASDGHPEASVLVVAVSTGTEVIPLT